MAQHLTRYRELCLLSILMIMTTSGSASAADIPRDPTLPPLSISAPKNSGTALTATPIELINIRGKHRSAIVRGISVRIGDQISEGRIINITEHGLLVKSDNTYSELPLYPDVSKHMHSQPSQHRIQR